MLKKNTVKRKKEKSPLVSLLTFNHSSKSWAPLNKNANLKQKVRGCGNLYLIKIKKDHFGACQCHGTCTALSTSAQTGLCQPLSMTTSIPKQISEMANTGTNVTEKKFLIYT